MDGFLSKPIRPHELQAVLAEVTIAADGPIAGPAGFAAARDPIGLPRETAIRDRLAELAGSDGEDCRELFVGMLRSLVDRGGRLLGELEEAVGRRAAADVEERAHSLKGAAANLGGIELARMLDAVEQQSRRGQLHAVEDDLGRVREEFATLSRSLVAVATELEHDAR